MKTIHAALALLLFLFIATSGCILNCNSYVRSATWMQDDVPVPSAGGGIDYKFNDLWGGIAREPESNRLHLDVFATQKVSHAELVQFAIALFSSKGWPAPNLEGAQESAGCGDSW